MELICKKCGSTAYHKSGHIHGKQRYKCKQCGHQYTKTTPHGKPERDKIISLVLVLSGLSMNATAKIIGVSTQTVMRWIRKMYDKFITCTPNIDNVQEVEMDEMHHYYQKKLKNYGSGKLLIIETTTSSGGLLDIAIHNSNV